MDLWRDMDRAAVEAARDEDSLNRFVTESRRFILRCASKACRRFITESDDEYEVALVAFCEAVKRFDPAAGSFNGFAALVIRRRLMDYFDGASRRRAEMPVGDAMTWDAEDSAQAGVMSEVRQALVRQSEDEGRSVRDEIEAVAGILKGYGFTFFEVAEASPRTARTKGFCARAVNWMLALVERVLRMRSRRSLPVRELSSECDLSHKVVDRHRRYIIAATEILDGDFPQLAEYLRYIKESRSS